MSRVILKPMVRSFNRAGFFIMAATSALNNNLRKVPVVGKETPTRQSPIV
jgi:hypothetical protein